MGLPNLSYIRILGIDYLLKSMTPAMADCAECSGFIDDEKAIIFIRDDLNPQVMAETILHEAFHGLLDGMSASESKDGDEALVIRLGRGMTSFIRDNHDLMEWIGFQL